MAKLKVLNGRAIATVNQAAQRVGVSRRTIYNWMEAGKIATVKTAGGLTRVYVDTLYQAEPERGPRVSSTEPASEPSA